MSPVPPSRTLVGKSQRSVLFRTLPALGSRPVVRRRTSYQPRASTRGFRRVRRVDTGRSLGPPHRRLGGSSSAGRGVSACPGQRPQNGRALQRLVWVMGNYGFYTPPRFGDFYRSAMSPFSEGVRAFGFSVHTEPGVSRPTADGIDNRYNSRHAFTKDP